MTVDARTLTLGYSGIGVDPTINGHVSIDGETNLGRVAQLRVAQSFSYEPTLVLGGTGSILGDAGTALAPEADIRSSPRSRRDISSSARGRRIRARPLERRWTPRQTTQVDAGYLRSTFLDELRITTRSRGSRRCVAQRGSSPARQPARALQLHRPELARRRTACRRR